MTQPKTKPIHVPKTVNQRRNSDGFPKARELIEMRPTKDLSLEQRRTYNLLIENAVGALDQDIEHEISVLDLRGGLHKGSERVRDSVKALMTTTVDFKTKDKNGLPAIRSTQLLVDTLVTIDEDDPRAILRYRFTKTMRQLMQNSTKWGRLKGYVLYAFTAKYSSPLYEGIAARINMDKCEEFFTLEEFRELLDVPKGKYPKYPQLKQKVIDPAFLEVNGLSDFVVDVAVKRKGGTQRGKIEGFTVGWRKKTADEWYEVTEELLRSKTGRTQRLKGTVEYVV